MSNTDQQLTDWHARALALESGVNSVIVGQAAAIRMITVAMFARGHVLLEGDVGVGKTTLLRACAQAIGGAYARVEGSIDLMPGDLVYYTYLNEQGSPRVDPGPLLQHGEGLATFFFNEINRARPQVHALLLRVMAERSVQAFNREYRLPHIQVFADRNQLEKEETFELPSAARDRFLMELSIRLPSDREIQRDLLTNPRYHDTDKLLATLSGDVLPFDGLNDIAGLIQQSVQSTQTLQDYVLNLCQATRTPSAFGIAMSGVEADHLIQAGVSPRGMSLLLRAARVVAWLQGREHLLPEDVRAVFRETVAHRVFLKPIYEMQRDSLMPEFIEQLLQQVSTP